jgi:hypothetical protein
MPQDTTARRQAQLTRPDPLSFHDRPATAYAWAQMPSFQDKNPLVMLVYLAAAEDADRAIHIEHGYHRVTAAELATMLGLEEATIQPSLDYLVEQGLLVEVPAQLVFGFPATGYRVSEAHFNLEER